MRKVFRVELSQEDGDQLKDLVRRGKLEKGRRPSALKLTQFWCLPKEHDAEFVWRIEDVLDVYARPNDPRFPEATPKQLTWRNVTFVTQKQCDVDAT